MGDAMQIQVQPGEVDPTAFATAVPTAMPTGGGGMGMSGPGANMSRFPPTGALKTKLCTKFMSGQGCPYGPNCNFAHGESDLRQGHSSQDPELLATRRFRLCNKLSAPGGCPYGDRCQFAHEMKPGILMPIFKDQNPSDGANVPAGGGEGGPGLPMVGRDGMPFNFKTKVCNKWLQGACPFGPKCHFAHGNMELRQRQPLPGGDVPGAPEGEWQETLRALRMGLPPPLPPAPPPSVFVVTGYGAGTPMVAQFQQPQALASVASAAANGDFAYASNPYADFLGDEYFEPPTPPPTTSAPSGTPAPPPGLPSAYAAQHAAPQSQAPPPFPSHAPPPPQGQPPEGYKSKLCENFQMYGSCPMGQGCQDAHGEADLRA